MRKCNKENSKLPKLKNLVGDVYGRLVVIKLSHVKKESYWLCKCECGNIKTVRIGSLRSGNTKSCGCLNTEMTILRNKKMSKYDVSTNDKLYWAWNHMLQRCFKDYENNKKYYKDRGITVCDEWKENFLAFREWSLNNGYKENLSLDRIDNNGNYEPKNCRWTTKEEQSNNTRSVRLIEYKGEIKSISQWARIFGIDRKTISYRLKNNWDIDSLFIKPYDIYKKEFLNEGNIDQW